MFKADGAVSLLLRKHDPEERAYFLSHDTDTAVLLRSVFYPKDTRRGLVHIVDHFTGDTIILTVAHCAEQIQDPRKSNGIYKILRSLYIWQWDNIRNMSEYHNAYIVRTYYGVEVIIGNPLEPMPDKFTEMFASVGREVWGKALGLFFGDERRQVPLIINPTEGQEYLIMYETRSERDTIDGFLTIINLDSRVRTVLGRTLINKQ